MSSIIKESSTNAHNARLLSEWCGVNDILRDISPRWKMVLLHQIAHGVAQYSLLKQSFPTLSDHVLSQRLAELVTEKLVRKSFVPETVPPQTRYSPTPKGLALLAIVAKLNQWGNRIWMEEQDA